MKGDIVRYEEPQVSISFRGKDSLVTLGDGKVTDFSGESLAYNIETTEMLFLIVIL